MLIRKHPISVCVPLWVAHDLKRVTYVVGCSTSQLVEALVGIAEPRLAEMFSFPDRKPYPVRVRVCLGHETYVQLLTLAGDATAGHGGGAWGIAASQLIRRILIHFLASVDTAGSAPPSGSAALLRSLDLVLPGNIVAFLCIRKARSSR